MARAVVAADFGGTKLALAVVTEDLQVVERHQVGSRERSAEELNALMDAFLQRAVARYRAEALGLAGPGIVGPDGRIELAANLPQWEGWSPEPVLRALPLPVVMLNDVKAAALAECRKGAGAGASVVLYVNAGTGFAAAAAVHGEVLLGAHGAAGEIGYWAWPEDPEGVGQGKIPLESRVGGWGVAQRARALGWAMEAEEVAHAQAPALRELWRAVCEEAARAVANAAVFLDPEVVILGGGMSRDPLLHQRVAAALAGFVPFPPRLERSRFGKDAGLIGAAMAALERMPDEAP